MTKLQYYMGCELLLGEEHRTLGAGSCGHPAAGDQPCKGSEPCCLVWWPLGNRVHAKKGKVEFEVLVTVMTL